MMVGEGDGGRGGVVSGTRNDMGLMGDTGKSPGDGAQTRKQVALSKLVTRALPSTLSAVVAWPCPKSPRRPALQVAVPQLQSD